MCVAAIAVSPACRKCCPPPLICCCRRDDTREKSQCSMRKVMAFGAAPRGGADAVGRLGQGRDHLERFQRLIPLRPSPTGGGRGMREGRSRACACSVPLHPALTPKSIHLGAFLRTTHSC